MIEEQFDLSAFVPSSADILYQRISKRVNWAMLYLFLCEQFNQNIVIIKCADVQKRIQHINPSMAYQMLEEFVNWGYIIRNKGKGKAHNYIIQRDLIKKRYVEKARETLNNMKVKESKQAE